MFVFGVDFIRKPPTRPAVWSCPADSSIPVLPHVFCDLAIVLSGVACPAPQSDVAEGAGSSLEAPEAPEKPSVLYYAIFNAQHTAAQGSQGVHSACAMQVCAVHEACRVQCVQCRLCTVQVAVQTVCAWQAMCAVKCMQECMPRYIHTSQRTFTFLK